MDGTRQRKKKSLAKDSKAFMLGDVDRNLSWEFDEFKRIMNDVRSNLEEAELLMIFAHIDKDGDGSIQLIELENFFYDPLRPSDEIRVTMDMNLGHPRYFLRYNT